jgi:L-alanine-DL-glutamate epimerase-like enolase superfamily enzyme
VSVDSPTKQKFSPGIFLRYDCRASEEELMRIETQRLTLRLENPFTIAHGTTTERQNVLVRICDGERTGVGEAAVVPYYKETPERVINALTDPAVVVALGDDARLLHDALDRLPPSESTAARAALDMALHDLWGQRLGQPLYRLWGLNPARAPVSSFTIALDTDEAAYRDRLRAAPPFSLYKIKLGSGAWQTDLDIARIARETTGAQIAVDANCAWRADDALQIIPRLAALDVAYIEQPIGRDDHDGWRALRDHRAADWPPLMADESAQNAQDVLALNGLADGVNIKLAKCGGLRAALGMVTLARQLGMRAMIGCMVESSVAVTAASHLAPLVDFADLDGNLLLSNDPYRGTRVINGQIHLPDAPGLGVNPVAE